jgi:hypothetical protein
MKNTLSDLNDYLFEQIERLQDDSLSEEQLGNELKRSDTITKLAKTIIDNGNLALNVKKHLDEYGAGKNYEMPALLGVKDV